jgi:hypothetical protein
VVVSGHELAWDAVRRTVDSQIEAAAHDQPDAALAELTVLRERLDTLARTGRFQRHPAEDYDDAVAEAFVRILPGARIVRSTIRSREVADFELVDRDRVIHVETKWRADPRMPFLGETLARLLPRLPADASLLVVTNAGDVSAARDTYSSTLDGRIRIVSWSGSRDDEQLQKALTKLKGG